jgi:exosome complex RNA-binding protein Csl4
VEFGVIHAVSATTGTALQPVSWDKMQDPAGSKTELRKVAKPDAEHN